MPLGLHSAPPKRVLGSSNRRTPGVVGCGAGSFPCGGQCRERRCASPDPSGDYGGTGPPGSLRGEALRTEARQTVIAETKSEGHGLELERTKDCFMMGFPGNQTIRDTGHRMTRVSAGRSCTPPGTGRP